MISCPKIIRRPRYRHWLLLLLLFTTQQFLSAQCTPHSPPIVSSAPFWNNFDIDGNPASNEFAILHYYTGSKIIAYPSLIRLYVVEGNLVNVADGVTFDGTENFSGTGEYADLAAGDWQIVFQYVPDGRLGFLQFTVTDDGNPASPDSISVTAYALQDPADSDGIVAGDCSSLANTVLPIELASFEVQNQAERVLLEWTTASEIDNLGFEVQRSLDAVHFESLAWVEGQGDSRWDTHYQYVDKTVLGGMTYYYRLVSYDRDGGGDHSPLRVARTKAPGELELSEVFPNPVFETRAKLQLVSERATELHWALYDGRGQLMKRAVLAVEKGVQLVDLELAGLPSGHYYLLAQSGGEQWKKSVIISH